MFKSQSYDQMLTHLRNYFLTGLFLILPFAATVWLLIFIISLVGRPLGIFLRHITGDHISGGLETAMGFVITFALVAAIGFFAQNLGIRTIMRYVDTLILRLPMVKTIYNTSKQILNAFTMQNKKAFRSVALIEYPRKGIYSLGFITKKEASGIIYKGEDLGKGKVSIFLPTTPNPTSGYFIMLPQDDVKELDLTIEEAVKLIISGGVLDPKELVEKER